MKMPDGGFRRAYIVELATVDWRLEEAVATGRRITAMGQEPGTEIRGWRYAVISTVRPLVYLGRAEEALDSLPQSSWVEDVELTGVAPLLRALCLAHMGRRTEATDIFRRFTTESGIGTEDSETNAHLPVIYLETAVMTEERDAVAPAEDRVAGIASYAGVLGTYTCPARHLGAAAALLGEPEKARVYDNQAHDVAGRIRFRPEIALTRLQLAELLLEHYPDERADAQEHLDFPIGEFRDMKMQPSLERAPRHREIWGRDYLS